MVARRAPSLWWCLVLLAFMGAFLLLLPPSVGAREISGDANYAAPSHGDDYLAIRADRGTLVEICGAGGCKRLRSTDYGPAKRTGDIADIGLYWFARICGYHNPGADDPYAEARSRGECNVTIEFIRGEPAAPRMTLPPTDTAPIRGVVSGLHKYL